MSVYVKLPYEDELAVIPDGVAVDVDLDKLSVLNESGKLVGVFNRSENWWIGDKVRPN